MKIFAGTDTEGSREGLASPAEFCKPAGLCVACEQQTHFRSSLLSLRNIGGREAKTGNASTVRRLGFVWNLTMFCMCDSAWNRCISTRSRKAFSFHEEHAKYELCNLQDVVTLHKESKETLHYLRRNEALIQSEIPSLPTFSMTHSPRKEGVNGVDRIATKGEKYWLPTKREKNYRLPIGKVLTDYRHGLTLSIFYFTEKGASCIFPTFLGRNLRIPPTF